MKIAAIWKYDKRPVNGAPFVYYATRLYSDEHVEEAEDDNSSGDQANVGQILYDYLSDCLTALQIDWGITHSEVILTTDAAVDGKLSPRLVEVNCRQHNMNFLPLVMGGIGYNLFDMVLAAYLGDDTPKTGGEDDNIMLDWDLLPDIPTTRMHAAMIHLVNTQEGTLVRVNEPALYEIQAMESVWDLEVYSHFLEPGQDITKTVDIKTDAGWVQLLHPHKAIFERDYKRIIEIMPTLFEVTEIHRE